MTTLTDALIALRESTTTVGGTLPLVVLTDVTATQEQELDDLVWGAGALATFVETTIGGLFTEDHLGRICTAIGNADSGVQIVPSGLFSCSAALFHEGQRAITGTPVQNGWTPTLTMTSAQREATRTYGIQTLQYGPAGVVLEHDYTTAYPVAGETSAFSHVYVMRLLQRVIGNIRADLGRYIGDRFPDSDTVHNAIHRVLAHYPAITKASIELTADTSANALSIAMSLTVYREFSFAVTVLV